MIFPIQQWGVFRPELSGCSSSVAGYSLVAYITQALDFIAVFYNYFICEGTPKVVMDCNT